jgi:hypothetical protein
MNKTIKSTFIIFLHMLTFIMLINQCIIHLTKQ